MAKLPDQMLNEHLRDEIRNIVRETVTDTVRELRKNGLLKRSDDVAYNEIGARLYEYYRSPSKDPEMGMALEKIKDDYYFPILPRYYEEKASYDWIAERFGCEISTVTRNKKRLCLKLFMLLQ